MRAVLIAAVLGVMALCTAGPTQASDEVRCDVLTIEASNRGLGIDAALAEHSAVLTKPPFSSFNTFKLVSRQGYDLRLGTASALALPAPMSGTLSFDSSAGNRLDLTLTITRPQLKPVMVRGSAKPGSPFFAAGFKSGGGTWIFGVICNRSELINH